MVDATLQVLRRAWGGRIGQATQFASDVPPLHRVVEERHLGIVIVCGILKASLDEAVTELAALEKITMPELQKMAKRWHLRMRMQSHCLARKKSFPDDVYDEFTDVPTNIRREYGHAGRCQTKGPW